MTNPQQHNTSGNAVAFEANGLRIEGLSWGDSGDTPMLALHGWLDNAASFSRLAPALEGHYVVALDLSGHGLTDRRSADANYQIWDDLPEILAVLDQLQWDTFNLIGHSRGAIISTLIASAFSDRVEKLVMLDAIAPAPVDESEFPQQMRKALMQKSHVNERKARVFDSPEEAVESRVRRGLSHWSADVIARRNLRACEGGYEWTTDPRLHNASQVKMSPGQIKAVLSGLDMPVLLMLAKEHFREGAEWMESTAREHIPNLAVETIEGSHHFHMDDNVTEVAGIIDTFLQREEG
jgi:pimeloyl-ACP methyl ester carboxylesterase